MRRRLPAIVGVLAGAVMALPAAAQAGPEPPAFKSPNVSFLTSLDEPQAISANFKSVGGKDYMFVSTLRGLSVYDISKPRAPVKIGQPGKPTLDLPHFENEDVSIGGDILLISNDPSEGKGVLFIIDIKDPRAPKILSTFDTGFIDIATDFFGLPNPYGTGHTASCVQECRYVYLAGTRQGINIVDLTDPKAPKFAGNYPAKEIAGFATHDVQFDAAGHALIAGELGTAAYDVTDPVKPQLLFKTDDSAKSTGGSPANDGKALNDFIHHNSMRMPNESLLTPPEDANPKADSDVMLITEEDYNRPTCRGAGQFETWRIGADNVVRNLDDFVVEVDNTRQSLCSAHYFDEDRGLVAQGWYEAGTRFLDVTNPLDIRQVGIWRPEKNVTWGAYFAPNDPTGETVYSVDNARGVDVLRVARQAPGAAPAPAVVAPPGDPGRPGSGGGDPGSGGGGDPGTSASGRPNVSLHVGNGRNGKIKPGQRLAYRLRVHNRSGVASDGVRVEAELPRKVRRRTGGWRVRGSARRYAFRVGRVAAGTTVVRTLRVRVLRGTRGVIEVPATLTATDDLNPRDNFAVDRDRVRRSKRSRASTSSPVVRGTSSMREYSAPPTTTGDQRTTARDAAALCRTLF